MQPGGFPFRPSYAALSTAVCRFLCGIPRDDRLNSPDDLAQKLAHPLVFGIGEEVLRCPLLNDLTVCHEHDPVGHLTGKAHLVGNDHHRDVLLVGQIHHDIQHFLNGLRVQRTGGLIEKDDLGLRAQRPGNGNALLLAAGKLGGVDIRLVPQTHDLEIMVRQLLGLLLDGYDEISLTNEFKVATCGNEKIYTPEGLGFARYQDTDLDGGQTPEDAAKIFDNIMNNTATEAQKNVVVINAAFAIQVVRPEKTIEECIALAKESLESGRALATLKKFIELNNK